MKGLKRAMAAEYSRELSAKSFAGQQRLAEMGYWMGGTPGYGLRRMRVNERGERKGTYERGRNNFLSGLKVRDEGARTC